MVCSRSGPTETISTGRPMISPRRCKYCRACRQIAEMPDAGNLLRQPGNVSYTGGAAQIVDVTGKSRHAAAVDFVSRADFDFGQSAQHVQQHDRQSIDAAQPGGVAAATASNQPQRRGRRVTVPYSLPRSRRCWPESLSCSVGKGPPPTRVL